jgi:ATP-binding cassette subfamily B protein
MALPALHRPLGKINQAYMQIRSERASLARIEKLLRAQPDICEAPDAVPFESPPRAIRLEGVSFAYDGEPALRGVTLEFNRRETIGIVGPSAAGKSALLNLLMRSYDPTDGRLLFDGTDLRHVRLADVNRQFALVPQTPFLFATTVRENIRLGRPEAGDGEVQQAARAARRANRARDPAVAARIRHADRPGRSRAQRGPGATDRHRPQPAQGRSDPGLRRSDIAA